jgi:hypothetical protein
MSQAVRINDHPCSQKVKTSKRTTCGLSAIRSSRLIQSIHCKSEAPHGQFYFLGVSFLCFAIMTGRTHHKTVITSFHNQLTNALSVHRCLVFCWQPATFNALSGHSEFLHLWNASFLTVYLTVRTSMIQATSKSH